MTYHSDIVRQRLLAMAYGPLMWRTILTMDRVVATSPQYIESSPVLRKLSSHRSVEVIPLGIEESQYDKQSPRALTGHRFNLQEPYILFLGVLRYYKGLHTLLQASRELHARVLIAGTGPELAQLRNFRKEWGLNHVEILGQVSEEEKFDLLANCTAFVLPSELRSEAFGMAMIEASMFGKPLISCEIDSGTSYVNIHLETGLVIEPRSPKALAGAINRLMTDKSLTEKLGKGARARYEKLFCAEALGSAYSNLYTEVLARHQSTDMHHRPQ